MSEYIDKLTALGDAATEGPWQLDLDQPGWYIAETPTETIVSFAQLGDGAYYEFTDEENDANADFIATSRNVWDELVAVVRALDGWLDDSTAYGRGSSVVEALAALKAKCESL